MEAIRDRKRSIPVRAPRFALDGEVPRAWLDGDLTASHVVDALSLIFPEGERFFIRSVKHYLDAVADDPELLEQVRGFFGQEGRHGHEHDRMNKILTAQGYDVEGFQRAYREIAYERIEKVVPPHLRLAATVALEHMTSTLAEIAFTTEALDGAHPRIREMLLWHAVEEIEHRAVTWDVLARVDPRMSTRAAGFAIGTTMLALFWTSAYVAIARDAKRLEPVPSRRSRSFDRAFRKTIGIVGRSVAEYFTPGFHPGARDVDHLASEHALRAGL
ncbi:MAG: metal-dependent hydrolase [Myxococcota bacterium]|nr:metal-dependent hydrolase [Myxococcota bacterium]